MTLDQIETFLTVADEGSFKAASEVLHRSQPALSIAVKKLEEELGIKLFNREQYRPTLTKNGKAFYRQAKDFFYKGKSLEKFGRQLGLGEEGEINVAIDSLTPLSFLTSALSIFSQEYPDTQLNLSFDVLGGAMEKLTEGKANIAITPQIEKFTPELSFQSLGQVEMVPVLSGKVVQKIEGSVTLQKIKNIPQIIVRDSSTKPKNTNHGILEGARQWTVQDMQTKKEIISSGLGWGRLPKHMIDRELNSGSFSEISLGNIKREEIEVFLVTNGHHPMGPLSQKLWKLFEEQKL